MKLFPFDEVLTSATKVLSDGGHFHQQFNCAHCGTKQTMEKPDVFFTTGKCEECRKITNIREAGCNMLVIFLGGKK